MKTPKKKKPEKVYAFETVAIPTHVDATAVAIAALSRAPNYPSDPNRENALRAVCAFFGYDCIKRNPQTSTVSVG